MYVLKSSWKFWDVSDSSSNNMDQKTPVALSKRVTTSNTKTINYQSVYYTFLGHLRDLNLFRSPLDRSQDTPPSLSYTSISCTMFGCWPRCLDTSQVTTSCKVVAFGSSPIYNYTKHTYLNISINITYPQLLLSCWKAAGRLQKQNESFMQVQWATEWFCTSLQTHTDTPTPISWRNARSNPTTRITQRPIRINHVVG